MRKALNRPARVGSVASGLASRPGRDPLSHLVEATGFHVVDETADLVLSGDEGASLNPGDRLPDVRLKIRKGFKGKVRTNADLVCDVRLHLIVAKGEHPAVGVVDQDDLFGAEQSLRDRQRADGVVGGDPARVANDVSIAFFQTENLAHMQAGIHACQDGELLDRRKGQAALVEGAGIGLVVLQEIIRHAHRTSSLASGGSVRRLYPRCTDGFKFEARSTSRVSTHGAGKKRKGAPKGALSCSRACARPPARGSPAGPSGSARCRS